MDIIDKVTKIAVIIEAAGGSVLGKSKFQKILYLVQETGLDLGYDYEYSFVGLFCFELEADLRIAESLGLINQIASEKYESPVKISLVPGALDDDEVAGAIRNNEQCHLVIIDVVKDESALVLEVLSMIIYLTKDGYKGLERDKHLMRLCGHLYEHFARAKELYSQHFQAIG